VLIELLGNLKSRSSIGSSGTAIMGLSSIGAIVLELLDI
jgi:hypothetical protein